MKGLCTLSVISLLLHHFAAAQSTFPGAAPPRIAAIVVGVSKYKYSTRYELRYAHRDAIQFSKLLKCAQNVELDTVITLTDQKATTGNFSSALQYLGRFTKDTSSRKIDYLLIYFSGHGRLGPDMEDQEGYFVMYNSGGPDSDTYGYAHSRLVKILKNSFSDCSRIIMIADACHSGRFTGASQKSINLPLLQEQSLFANEQDRVIEILSSEGGKESFESPNLQHGLFTYYLIRGAEGEAYAKTEGIPSLRALQTYLEKNVDPDKQVPVIRGDGDFFLSFDSCLNYSRIKPESFGEKLFESKHKSLPYPLPLEILFDSLLFAGSICLPVHNSAYSVLKTVKNMKEYAGVYQDMRLRYITAVLDEDVDITYRYLNQDLVPWLTKFVDIEKEIQMQKTLLDLLQPEDFLYRKTTARYFYFQAMAWYEYSKFVSGFERTTRLQKANRMIVRSLKVRPDSPSAYFLQSQISLGLNPGARAKERKTELEETHRRAPEWRLPYLYAHDRASLQQYKKMVDDYKSYSAIPVDVVPIKPEFLNNPPRTITPDQLADVFSDNPVLAEDLFLGYVLEGKSSEKALEKHRKMAFLAYNLSARFSGRDSLPEPGKAPVVNELDKLSASNNAAEKSANNELLLEKKLEEKAVVSEETKERWAELGQFQQEAVGTNNSPGDSRQMKSNPDSYFDSLAGKFILVRGGVFMMGCSGRLADCYEIEKPVHQVTLNDYYIGETEVTQAQWKKLMGTNPSYFSGCNDCPVEKVSWDDVQLFLSRLNERMGGFEYRLPTEAEWEYAARGGNMSRSFLFAGSDDLDAVGWFADNSGGKTHPVRKKTANELGLYDMSGNVWEWCLDWYANYSGQDESNPRGAVSGLTRVRRGGSWGLNSKNCRISNRNDSEPDYRNNLIGFRLVAVAKQ